MKSLFSDIKYNKPWQLFFVFIVTGIITVCGFSTSIKAAEIDFPFYPGEKLTFQLRWSLIPAGKAVLEVLPMETINGIKSYHFVMTAKTNSFVDVFYKFRTRIDAYTDIKMTCTLGYDEPADQDLFDSSTTNEGDYIFDEMSIFSYPSDPSNQVPINTSTMLTHVIFHPVQKSQNRIIEIIYTIRIQLS